MSSSRRFRQGLTALEAFQEIERRKQTDPAYRAQIEAMETERAERIRAQREAEAPIVEDLRAEGIEISSAWDLVNSLEPYPRALPVLLRHLSKGTYPERVLESLGRALGAAPASEYWSTLRDLYLKLSGGAEEGLAVALAASATEEQLEDLMRLVNEPSKGEAKLHFLNAIKRVGGSRGRQFLKSLESHPTFGREASALLRSRSKAARLKNVRLKH